MFLAPIALVVLLVGGVETGVAISEEGITTQPAAKPVVSEVTVEKGASQNFFLANS